MSMSGPGRSTTATAFAVFAAAWMLLVMQPCLAALEPISGSHAGHHDCPHCPAEVAPPCADGTLDCGTPDAAPAADPTTPKPPVAALYVAPLSAAKPVTVVLAAHPHERPRPTGPPLTERFCCHLE